jgi:hypothetical protein
MTDPHERIDHPKHYNAHPSGVECIDVIEHLRCNIANAVKYVWRADHKASRVEDLRKARWYVERELTRDGFDEGPFGPIVGNVISLTCRFVEAEPNPRIAEAVDVPFGSYSPKRGLSRVVDLLNLEIEK